jgi:hypothetical protein
MALANSKNDSQLNGVTVRDIYVLRSRANFGLKVHFVCITRC